MEATLRDLDGEEAGTVELPAAFSASYRPDLIRRAVVAAQANRTQRDGADPFAGKRTPAESFGSGRGLAHVPRQDGRARRVPQAIGGRTAHPPKASKDPSQKINDKERRQAVKSAIAATADETRVRERGHAFNEDVSVPVVVTDALEGLMKTQAALDALENLGLGADIERADQATIRAGRGTTRGRKYQRPKSILVVTSESPSKAARNLAGVDVATGREVNVEDLAPGTHPGRLTVWTESALAEVAERFADDTADAEEVAE